MKKMIYKFTKKQFLALMAEIDVGYPEFKTDHCFSFDTSKETYVFDLKNYCTMEKDEDDSVAINFKKDEI